MKRAHVFLLTIVLAMLWSFTAFAVVMEVKDDAELSSAIEDATVEEIVLTDNIITSGGYYIDRNVIIRSKEGEHYSITHDENNTVYKGLFSVTGTIEIHDLTIAGFSKDIGHGGAVMATGSVTVQNSNFENNKALEGSGGAVWMESAESDLVIAGSSFENNEASISKGGAISAIGATVTIEDCRFVENLAFGGGGIFANVRLMAIRNSHFDGNAALLPDLNGVSGSGGAVQASDSIESLVIEDCTFVKNEAGHWGGAVALSGTKENAMLDIKGSEFTENKATDVGGAVQGKNVTIANCIFTKNEATGTEKSYGGAVFGSEIVTISDSTFQDNQASESAGAVQGAKSGAVTVTNCVFDGNSVNDMGGAISSYMGPITIKDCDFYGNEAGGNGGSVCSEDGGEIHIQGSNYFDGNVTGGEELAHGLWTSAAEMLVYAEEAQAMPGRREQTDIAAQEADVSDDFLGAIEVINDGVNVRTNPGTGDDAKVVGKAAIGETFHVSAQDEATGWYQFTWKDGQEVWISPKTVEFTPAGD